jgi:hypothetical protein
MFLCFGRLQSNDEFSVFLFFDTLKVVSYCEKKKTAYTDVKGCCHLLLMFFFYYRY